MRDQRAFGWAIVAALALAVSSLAADSPEDAARKILAQNCGGCHGEARMSGLDLRDISSILKGGTRGPAVVPGRSADSLLYKAIAGAGDLKMPPGKPPLSPDAVRAIATWIDSGAKWSDSPGAIADPSWWAFRKPQRPAVPQVKNSAWVRTPVDAFILSKLESERLTPAPPADKTTLVRRLYFDLTGMPPAPEDVSAFLADQSADAYEKLVDRLLASPHYGERWGRHWLDVVRYADTSGFESDLYLRNAWRYRDWVIAAFNQDTPYDEFVKAQIAADELWPNTNELEGLYILPKQKQIDLERRIGTGMYTVGPFDPSSALDGAQLRYDRLTDMADTTASAFLGLSMGCARCHDHKFDPITQKDYYRLQAIFAGSEEKEIPVVDAVKVVTWRKSEPKQIELDDLKDEVARLDAAVRKRGGGARKGAKLDFTPAEKQRRDELLGRIAELYVALPKPYPKASVLGHSDIVPDIHVAMRGDYRNPGEVVGPGFPAILANGATINEPDERPFVPQRRKALALWLTQPDHPLTARVMVNRIWQWNFGRGIVATPNDFGRQGELPSHPELLDWLATEFVAHGWSIKTLQRTILLSNAYRMSDRYDAAAAKVDPTDRYLWRFDRQRLDAEEVRDAVLSASGSLNGKAGGPPVVPALEPDEVDALGEVSLWPATVNREEPLRRSIYMYVKRMFRLPMLASFDEPDNSFSCARRDVTNVAPQALTLMNSRFMFQRARDFADRLAKKADDPAVWVDQGWQLALSRAPAADERQKALEMFAGKSGDARQRVLVEFCLMLFNLNEFIYVD
jgi:mono/diheme cytochrome c family protein